MSSAAPFRVASVLASYPSSEALDRLELALDGLPAAERSDALGELLDTLDARPGRELEEEYIELFDRGVADNPLHATGFARERAFGMAERLADVGAFYRAFGVASTGGERLDHVAVELEFYAWMVAKEEFLAAAVDPEGHSIVAEGRRKFLGEHLAPLAAAISTLPAVAAHPVYGRVFAWVCDVVRREAAAEGLDITPLELTPGRSEPDEWSCPPERSAAAAGPLRVI